MLACHLKIPAFDEYWVYLNIVYALLWILRFSGYYKPYSIIGDLFEYRGCIGMSVLYLNIAALFEYSVIRMSRLPPRGLARPSGNDTNPPECAVCAGRLFYWQAVMLNCLGYLGCLLAFICLLAHLCLIAVILACFRWRSLALACSGLLLFVRACLSVPAFACT